MKIFSDMHHGGLSRSLFLLFKVRLGHDIYYPDATFASWANQKVAGTWLTPNMGHDGGIPPNYLVNGQLPFIVSRQQFLDEDWDAVIMSRPESQSLMRGLLSGHRSEKKIKRIAQTGNDGTIFDWDWIPNFLSSDYLCYQRWKNRTHAIHYMQELGLQFQPTEFTPISADALKSVHTYINCLSSFGPWQWNNDQGAWNGRCPHCESHGPVGSVVSIRDLWAQLKAALPQHQFRDYGIVNSCGMLPETEMPQAILNSALTWCYKTYEGYGHSIAQSVSMGRLCIVPARFFRYRTANQFLIPNLTCLEADWSFDTIRNRIAWFTDSLDRANEYSLACFKAARAIFNWEHESVRVREWLEGIR